MIPTLVGLLLWMLLPNGMMSTIIPSADLASVPPSASSDLYPISPDTTFSPDYRWPIDISRHLSGTFGETRSAHFHTGLDMKTWGQEGYPVFATEEGYISRIAISAQGYGKVLYITHPNGYTSVYAHLQRFTPAIQRFIDSIRVRRDYRFEIDLDLGYAENAASLGQKRPQTTRFPVNRGQRIAYSGSSGIGPPHLHFELRDPAEIALNALEYGIDVKDQVTPTIRSMMVLPLSPESRVNGSARPQLVSVESLTNEGFDFGQIEVQGPIGVAFDSYDGADEVTNKYAFYESWLINHQSEYPDTVFHQRIDALEFSQGDAMFVDRLKAPGSRRRSYQAFFPQEGPEVPFYKKVRPGPGVGGALDPSDSIQRFELLVKDFHGNESRAYYELVPHVGSEQSTRMTASSKATASSTTPVSSPTREHHTPTEHPFDWYWQTNWVSPSDSVAWSLATLGPVSTQNPSLTQTNGPTSTQDPSQSNWWHQGELFSTARIIPDQKKHLRSPDKRIHAYIRPNTFDDTLSLHFSHTEWRVDESYTLPILSLLPLPILAKQPIQIKWYVGDYLQQLPFDQDRMALFSWDAEENEYRRVSSELKGGHIHARISSEGLYTLWADTTAPTLTRARLSTSPYGSDWVVLNYSEEHSGLNTTESTLLVNGQKGIVEFDFEEDAMIFYLPGWKAPTNQTVEVSLRLTDGSGNTREELIQLSKK